MESAASWVGSGNPSEPVDALALGEFEIFGTPGDAARLAINTIDYDVAGDNFRFTWNSQLGNTYTLNWSLDLINWDNDINDNIASDSQPTTFPPINQPGTANPLPGEDRLFFRIEENPSPGQ